MTSDQLAAMAREAGIGFGIPHSGPDGIERFCTITDSELSRFASLVLEEAARTCDDLIENRSLLDGDVLAEDCAATLRALAQQAGGEKTP